MYWKAGKQQEPDGLYIVYEYFEFDPTIHMFKIARCLALSEQHFEEFYKENKSL